VVSSKKSVSRFVSKDCKDWVCQYNILNCNNHRSGSTPIDGEIYLYRFYPNSEVQQVVYAGCGGITDLGPEKFTSVKPISISKEFYKPDYSDGTINNPEYLSTLYWNPLINFKETAFQDSFYTSDLQGTFVCFAEGIINGVPVRLQVQLKVE
jgi:hypothetical protein